MTRVVIAAGSPTVRAGLGALLAGYPGLTVLEVIGRPAGLAELAETVEADVVLLALEAGEQLPLPLGLPPDAAGREPAVVVLGDETTEGWVQRALRAGARGALPRTGAVSRSPRRSRRLRLDSWCCRHRPTRSECARRSTPRPRRSR